MLTARSFIGMAATVCLCLGCGDERDSVQGMVVAGSAGVDDGRAEAGGMTSSQTFMNTIEVAIIENMYDGSLLCSSSGFSASSMPDANPNDDSVERVFLSGFGGIGEGPDHINAQVINLRGFDEWLEIHFDLGSDTAIVSEKRYALVPYGGSLPHWGAYFEACDDTKWKGLAGGVTFEELAGDMLSYEGEASFSISGPATLEITFKGEICGGSTCR